MKGGALLPVVAAGLVPIALFTLLVLGIGLQVVAWRPPLLWSDQFGVSGGYNGATSIAANSAGVIAAGYLNSTQFGLSGGDFFIRRYQIGGGLIWTKTFPLTPLSGPLEVSIGTDGVYGVLQTNDTISVLKYDFNGVQMWTRQFRGLIDMTLPSAPALSATARGVYVAGQVNGEITNQSFTGNYVAFVREYDTNGNVVWTSEFSNSTGSVNGVYADSSGVYALTTGLLVKFDPNGNEMWKQATSIGACLSPNDAAGSCFSGDSTGVYLSSSYIGYYTSTGFLTKYDQDGKMLWTIHFTSPDGDVGEPMVAAGSSGVFVKMFDGAGNSWVNKYDENGNQMLSFQTNTVAPGARTNNIVAGPDGLYDAGEVGKSGAFVDEFGQNSSLVFFGLNPPWSFSVLGGLLAMGAISFFYFRRMRRRRLRPTRIGPTERSLPTRD